MSKSTMLFRKTTAVILAVLVATTTLFSFSLTADAKAKKYVKSIKASKKKITLTVGKSKRVKITVKATKKINKKFTVKSSKKSVATAKVSGSSVKITAKKAGKARITVTTKSKGRKGKKLKTVIAVTVKAKAKSSSTPVKPIVNPSSQYYGGSSTYDNPFVLRLGSNESLYAIDPVFRDTAAQISAAKTEFESSDSAVVFVNNKGIMTGNRVTDKPVYIYTTITDKQGQRHCFTAYVIVSDVVAPSTNPAADGLERISIKANPSTITVGGVSKLTVTSESEGVSIYDVVYKSSNETIATVDANGIVTGRTASNSPVAITATAYDAKGNSASASVNITVVEASSSDAKISEVPDNLVLGVGVTRKLKPVASNAGLNPVFTYESDNPSVADVNSSGEIVTKSNGEARITVTIAGTTASAICFVTVKNVALGISSFGATHAKILTINLTSSVNASNRDDVEVTLKKGSAVMDVKREWSEDGSSINLTTDAEFEPTVYTVKISSDKVSVDENNNTADCVVSKHEIVDVKITSQRIPRANGAKIYFDAIDNYGDKVKDADPSLFNWQFSCDDTKVRTTDISVSLSKPDCIVLENFKEIDDVVVDSTVINVQAILKKNADIRTDKNINVVSLVIDKIEINDIETLNGAKYIYQDVNKKPYKLIYTAVDQYGDPIDWSLYKPNSSDNAYNNTFQAHSDNEEVVSAPTIFNEELVVYVNANKHGTAKVYAVAKDPNYKTYTIEVLETPKPQKIVFPDAKEHSVVAGEDADYKVPVTFIDQYGTEMTRGAVTKKVFTASFTSNPSNKDLIIDYVSDNESDSIIFNAKNLTSETESVTVVFTAFNDNDEPITSSFKVKVDAERRPDSIKFTDNIPSSLVVGETAEFKFRILDNRGEYWTDPNGIVIEMDANDIGDYLELVDVDFDENCDGVMKIRGVSESIVNFDPHITLGFKLYYLGNEISSTTFTPPKVIVYKNLDDIKIGTDIEKGKAIKSGQHIELTFSAYNNDKYLDTYNHTYNKVVVTEYDSDKGKTENDKTQLVNIEFVNGQAKAEIEAQTAGNIVYEIVIPAVGVSDPFVLKTAPAIKVNPGDASYYDLLISNEGGAMTIICRDMNGNVIKGYSPAESTYITLKDSNDTALKADEYFNNVATKNGEIISEFTEEGTLTISLKKDIPSGFEITVKTGSITKTIKV